MDTTVSAVTVFVQGLLSFLSPCVLPVVPLYLGYLAGDAGGAAGVGGESDDGARRTSRRRLIMNAFAFCIGVSAAFFVLGLGASALGGALNANRSLIAAVGGAIVIALGIWQLYFYGRGTALDGERRLHFDFGRFAMSPVVALAMGFGFSFAWTPCVGPALTSVMLMTASSSTAAAGFALIALYALGFSIPFMAVAFAADKALVFFRSHEKALRHTVQAGGFLLVLTGALMITGYMGGVSSIFAGMGTSDTTVAQAATTQKATAEQAPDFSLVDQNGMAHTLSEYKGKVVFLNFWATWCEYCTKEMPDIQELYEAYGENSGDVVILGLSNPKDDTHPNNTDVTQDKIESFLSERGYTYPVLMDLSYKTFSSYAVFSFPTSYVIGKDGTVFQKISGATTKSVMNGIIKQALAAG